MTFYFKGKLKFNKMSTLKKLYYLIRKIIFDVNSEYGNEQDENYTDFLNEILLTAPLNINIDIAEIKECTYRTGDFGIFAKRDIKIDEVITLYPVHVYENSLRSDNVIHFKNHVYKISP